MQIIILHAQRDCLYLRWIYPPKIRWHSVWCFHRETNLTLHVGVNKEQRAQIQAERKQRKQETELIYAQKNCDNLFTLVCVVTNIKLIYHICWYTYLSVLQQQRLFIIGINDLAAASCHLVSFCKVGVELPEFIKDVGAIIDFGFH